ncbi:MAG: hypothetical protein GTO18_13870 [Anaerolineales bacterium]|nr:hypothetical protein [Anaerolineales bacterium]
MQRRRWILLVGMVLFAMGLTSCGSGRTFSYDFEEDDEGWAMGFADLPVDADLSLYELDSGWRELPPELDGFGIYMQGHNRSDDLFMYLKVQVDGLDPNTTYQVIFDIDPATAVPEGLMGIGGSPGESVYVKAGATVEEPEVFADKDGWIRINIDKGNQATEGEDMINLGNIAHSDVVEEEIGQYKIKPLDNDDRPFIVTTGEEGTLWFIVGTDSGFEGLTAVYYDKIRIKVSEAD